MNINQTNNITKNTTSDCFQNIQNGNNADTIYANILHDGFSGRGVKTSQLINQFYDTNDPFSYGSSIFDLSMNGGSESLNDQKLRLMRFASAAAVIESKFGSSSYSAVSDITSISNINAINTVNMCMNIHDENNGTNSAAIDDVSDLACNKISIQCKPCGYRNGKNSAVENNTEGNTRTAAVAKSACDDDINTKEEKSCEQGGSRSRKLFKRKYRVWRCLAIPKSNRSDHEERREWREKQNERRRFCFS